MSKAERQSLIAALEKERDSKIIVYITGDRPGLETKIANDIFPIFNKHLRAMGEQKRIDLFLYSTGGLTNAGYALVNLLREYCKEFNVIVPFRALSSATLISLGANEIVMTKMGQLSPIDPSLEHPLGPTVSLPGQPPRIMQISVEDVNAFFSLAKSSELKSEDSMKQVFQILASTVNPLALGAVQRSREQIVFLADELMKCHDGDKEHIKKVIEILTKGRFSHDYIIGPTEARQILGPKVINPNPNTTKAIYDLFDAYNKMLLLDTPYTLEPLLGGKDKTEASLDRAVIESTNFTHIFRTVREVRRIQVAQPGVPAPVIAYQERPLQESWIIE
jgi:sulfur relay (sulfurtransferase) DsrC/TusE family protein